MGPLTPRVGSTPLPLNQPAAKSLESRLTSLQMVMPRGVNHSSVEREVENHRYTFPANAVGFDSVTAKFGSDAVTLTVEQNDQSHSLEIGYREWRLFETGAFNVIDKIPMPHPRQRAGGSGAWTNDHTFLARIGLPETPFVFDLKFTFRVDSTATLAPSLNVNRGAPYPDVTSSNSKPRRHWFFAVEPSDSMSSPTRPILHQKSSRR